MFLFLSNSFGIETINKFIHSRRSLENHTHFQTKMGKVHTVFRPYGAKTLLFWEAHTYMAYIPPQGVAEILISYTDEP